MLIIINLLILSIVLFLYIHIYNHNKTSNYLELYELESLSKEKLEDVINFKQPMLLNNYNLVKNINMKYLLSEYSIFNINLYNKTNNVLCKTNLQDFYNSITTNSGSINYLSYNNEEFLQETSIDKILCKNDIFFRPPNMCNKKYDIIMGAKNNYTQLKYSINSRNLLYLSSGQVEVTLCPPKYYKNLHVKKNYEMLEFYSQIDIYNVESNYRNDYNKIKFLRLLLNVNQVLVIPPYWFYSIKFIEKHSIVLLNTYTTYINYVSLIPHLCMQLLQLGNVKLNIIKKKQLDNIDNKDNEEKDNIDNKEKDNIDNEEKDNIDNKEKDNIDNKEKVNINNKEKDNIDNEEKDNIDNEEKDNINNKEKDKTSNDY